MSSMISEYGLPETADMMSGIVLQQLRSLKNVRSKWRLIFKELSI